MPLHLDTCLDKIDLKLDMLALQGIVGVSWEAACNL